MTFGATSAFASSCLDLPEKESSVVCSAQKIDATDHYSASDSLRLRQDSYIDWKADQYNDGRFWQGWVGENNSPVLHSQNSSSFYGLGFWQPSRYADQALSIEDIDDAKEWLKSYGLQMSLGFGGDDGVSPRFRFDYRWHEDRDLDDIYLQVEIPFQ